MSPSHSNKTSVIAGHDRTAYLSSILQEDKEYHIPCQRGKNDSTRSRNDASLTRSGVEAVNRSSTQDDSIACRWAGSKVEA